jgi:hypothetical protein
MHLSTPSIARSCLQQFTARLEDLPSASSTRSSLGRSPWYLQLEAEGAEHRLCIRGTMLEPNTHQQCRLKVLSKYSLYPSRCERSSPWFPRATSTPLLWRASGGRRRQPTRAWSFLRGWIVQRKDCIGSSSEDVDAVSSC